MNPPNTAAHDVLPAELDGERVAVVVPAICEDYPPAVREGLARRRIVQTGGTCPCGARMVLPNRAARRRARRTGEILRATAQHADDCPAVDVNLTTAAGHRR